MDFGLVDAVVAYDALKMSVSYLNYMTKVSLVAPKFSSEIKNRQSVTACPPRGQRINQKQK